MSRAASASTCAFRVLVGSLALILPSTVRVSKGLFGGSSGEIVKDERALAQLCSKHLSLLGKFLRVGLFQLAEVF